MTDRIEVVNYSTLDTIGVKPNSNDLFTTWRNNKTGQLYSLKGVGFNTHTQLWEYQYLNLGSDIVFHRSVKEFYEKFTKIDVRNHGIENYYEKST